MHIGSVLVSAVVLGALTVSPAHAGKTRVSAYVEYADLDLSQPEGVAVLEKRLDVAVRQMCGSYERRDGMGERPLKQCAEAARLEPQLETLVARARAEQATLAAR